MVILTILSLAEVVVPHLGMLYWALVSQYPEGWTPPMLPWYDTTPSHDNNVEEQKDSVFHPVEPINEQSPCPRL
ncbi:hypothetical protein DSO57_1020508 [Entomophthora muscae]|uniref:Uncharacterized protein n=1 Tax=Entomophthora muscae TaxID=34485 RepID=A0ACC2RIC4_9FUNG|nr:hypothetical protein DSO57_1020508 [Entomophthora muscae]